MRQHEHLNRHEASREDTHCARGGAHCQPREPEGKRNQAAANRETFNKKMSDAVNQMRTCTEAKKQETDAAVEDWKRRREVKKLEYAPSR